MPIVYSIYEFEEQFLNKTIIQDNGCWIWSGGLTTSGYGQLKKHIWGTYYAHQWACNHWNKSPLPIAKGYCIKHSCDVKRCVNPDHLSYGTVQENIQEMIDRNPDAMGRKTPSESEIELLRQMIIDEVPKREMMRRIGYSRSWINRVIRDYF